jgi:hypothetical protein
MTEHKVVDLVDAGVPADQGLSGLGLLMQLAGNVLAAYAALLTFAALVTGGGGGGDALWILLVLGLSIARSLMHRSAGTQLLYGPRMSGLEGGTGNRFAGVRRYIVFGLIQSVAVAAILMTKLHPPTTFALGVMLGLAAWPIALAIIFAMPRFRRFKDDVPVSEDKGFEGASILMTVLGLCGLVGAGTALLVMLAMSGSELQRGANVLLVLSLIMLLVRSGLHVQAGMSGLRETSVDRSVELANRYANFGVISSFCMGGALLLFAMSSMLDLAGIALVCGVVWMLMAWPLIVRRFYSDRQFGELLAGDNAPVHRRAPDAGLTSLGWLLIASAMFSASFLLPAVFSGAEGSRDLSGLFAIGGAFGVRSPWWSVGLAVLQAWAGYELIRMSAHSRIVATVYGAVGVVVTMYINWPVMQMLGHARGMAGGSESMMIGPLALALILPIATIALVNRKIAPTARARFRPKAEPPQS